MGRHITHDDRPSTDHCAFSDDHFLYYGGSASDESADRDLDAATQCYARGDMDMGAQTAIVVHACRGIDDSIAANDNIRLQYRTGHHLSPFL